MKTISLNPTNNNQKLNSQGTSFKANLNMKIASEIKNKNLISPKDVEKIEKLVKVIGKDSDNVDINIDMYSIVRNCYRTYYQTSSVTSNIDGVVTQKAFTNKHTLDNHKCYPNMTTPDLIEYLKDFKNAVDLKIRKQFRIDIENINNRLKSAKEELAELTSKKKNISGKISDLEKEMTKKQNTLKLYMPLNIDAEKIKLEDEIAKKQEALEVLKQKEKDKDLYI